MKILVIRHADALDTNGNSIRTDFDRPLSEKGIKQALRLKKGLLKANFLPEIVLSSPLIRTSQTSKLVFPEVFTQNKSFFERSELKPGAHPEIICKIINEYNPKSIALVGHMPDVGVFVSWLIGASGANIEMEKCGAALLEFHGLPREGTGSLKWLVGPEWKYR